MVAAAQINPPFLYSAEVNMAQSFGVVEGKLCEAEFFLSQFSGSSRFSFDAQCYFSAFVSAARSVTLALQATMSGTADFDQWYQAAQARLKGDPQIGRASW